MRFNTDLFRYFLLTQKSDNSCPVSAARRVVYTCVFGRYDFVLPPKCIEPDTDYILICDDANWRVRGWTTWVVDPQDWGGAILANRYHKFFAHVLFPRSDYSCYIDGNSHIVGPLEPLMRAFIDSGACLGLQKHGYRTSLKAELEACRELGKLAEPSVADAEYTSYLEEGFDDTLPLTGNNVLLRRHDHVTLPVAMELWWTCFKRYKTRDQLSLPYVRWKTGLTCHYFGFVFNDPNPYLHIHRHRTKLWRSNLIRYCEARGPDHAVYRLIFAIGRRFEHAHRVAGRGKRRE